MKPKLHFAIVLLAFFAIAGFFHLAFPGIAEIDSFFYIRDAWRYRTEGIFNVNFPWMQFGMPKELSVASWYGFGIFSIPFTYFSDLITGLKVEGVLLTVFALGAYFWVALKRGFVWPAFWPFLFLFSAPNVLYRLIMVRPQIFSLAFAVLLLSFLAYDTGKSGKRYLAIGLFSFAIAWLHFNFAWLPFVIAGVVAGAALFLEKRFYWREVASTVIGAVIGWLLRPEPLKAIQLLYIQFVKHTFVKANLPLLFGSENFPLTAGTLIKNFGPITILWLLAIGLFCFALYSRKFELARNKIFLWSAGILSFLFFLVSVFIARRAYDFWIAFGVLFVAAVFTEILPRLAERKQNAAFNIKLFAVCIFAFLTLYSGFKTSNSLKASASPPDRLRNVALWVGDHSVPGDIVFNLHWSHFSPLFFWNQKNYYVGGLDPIFQYEYNPGLYWKFHYLSADIIAEKTCGKIECAENELEDTHEVLVRDFGAKFIVFDKRDNPKVYALLENDPRFELGIESGNEVAFVVK